jgi:ABC-2 type transport system permease protein
MTAHASHQPPGRYRFRQLARMEWIKLRSLRSTWLTLAIAVAASAGIALAIGSSTTSGGAVALITGEAAAFLSFFAGCMTLRHGITAPALSQPGVLRAIVLTGASLSLIGLLGLGLGAIIRHTAAAITVVVGIVCVGGPLNLAIRPYLPIYIVSHSLSATTPLCRPGAASCWLSAWSGLGMLAIYAAIAMVLGALILARRDA